VSIRRLWPSRIRRKDRVEDGCRLKSPRAPKLPIRRVTARRTFSKRTHLDLTHPLRRHAEFVGDVRQLSRRVG